MTNKIISYKNFFLFISIIIFVTTIAFTNFGYLKDREYPYGFDDYFSYIIKSKNLEKCWLSDCKGLQSIEDQIISIEKQSENLDLENSFVLAIERQKARIFKDYHPLYSFIILGFDQFFDDLLKSRIVAHIFLIIFISISLMLFSNLLFGKATTFLLLTIFSLNNHGGFGFGHNINPYVLSQSISMIVFYSLVKVHKKNVILFNVLASLTHPIGIFTNGITCAYTLIFDFKERIKMNSLIIFINLFLIFFIFFNELSFLEKIDIRNSEIFPNSLSFLGTIKNNIKTFYYVYTREILVYYTFPVIILSTILYLFIKREKRTSLMVILIYLVVFLLPLIDKPNVNLSRRFMNIGSVVMIGTLCFVFIQSSSLFFSKFFKKEKFNIVYPKFGYILYLFPILLFSLLININLGIKNFKDYYSTLNNNYDLKFSPNQTDLIEGENVLIFNQIERADYFYMLKGLHKENYFYYFKNDKKILNMDLIKKNIPIYFVTMTPFYHTDTDEYFSKKDRIVITNNENEETFFKIETSKKTKILVNGEVLKLNENNVKNLSKNISLKDNKINIEVLDGKIRFLKIGKQKDYNFPWQKKISVLIDVNNVKKLINFQLPKIFGCEAVVKDDNGSSMLFALSNCNP